MGRNVEGSRRTEIVDGGREWAAISFAQIHANSEAFKALFKEGMALVEAAAAYLDGPGRTASKALPRHAALAYATESMRLTTRLMQVASWLLLRRAVNEGELTQAQALSERHRVRLSLQALSCGSDLLAQLPSEFVELCAQSIRLQARVLHLDQATAATRAAEVDATPRPLATQLAMIEQAFARANA
jgi:regulator of CtrA degradation